jgi:pimeloyl-ACP methyl ester carboxylesterase
MQVEIHDRPGRAMSPITLSLLTAVFFLAFCSTAAQASSATSGDIGAPIAWGACDPPGPDLQCARIAVPLDWKDPGGRTISLAVIRHLAKPQERIGTMFINPGGPADTGVGLVQGDPTGVDAIGGGRFDVVSWDPRGSNASTRVLCFNDQREESRFWSGASFPSAKTASEQMLRLTSDLAQRCGEMSG